MAKISVFFDNLNFDAQSQLWQAVQRELLARGEVEYREVIDNFCIDLC